MHEYSAFLRYCLLYKVHALIQYREQVFRRAVVNIDPRVRNVLN